MPTSYYFSIRKEDLESVTKNSLYKATWSAIWIGHLILYSLPGLLWPVSFAARPGFNTIYVMWMQYGTYYSGILLSVTVWILYVVSYFTYTDESALDQSSILYEGSVYFGTSLLATILLF